MKIFSNGITAKPNLPKNQKNNQVGFKGENFILVQADRSLADSTRTLGALNSVVLPLADRAQELCLAPSAEPPRFAKQGTVTTLYQLPDGIGFIPTRNAAGSYMTKQQLATAERSLVDLANQQIANLEEQGSLPAGSVTVKHVPWKQADTVQSPEFKW